MHFFLISSPMCCWYLNLLLQILHLFYTTPKNHFPWTTMSHQVLNFRAIKGYEAYRYCFNWTDFKKKGGGEKSFIIFNWVIFALLSLLSNLMAFKRLWYTFRADLSISKYWKNLDKVLHYYVNLKHFINKPYSKL